MGILVPRRRIHSAIAMLNYFPASDSEIHTRFAHEDAFSSQFIARFYERFVQQNRLTRTWVDVRQCQQALTLSGPVHNDFLPMYLRLYHSSILLKRDVHQISCSDLYNAYNHRELTSGPVGGVCNIMIKRLQSEYISGIMFSFPSRSNVMGRNHFMRGLCL